jgi:hypothetical protein
MKSLKIISLLLLAIAFYSCQPPTIFGEPQPVGVEGLSTTPYSYRGMYWCKVDSASLFVDEKAFVKERNI